MKDYFYILFFLYLLMAGCDSGQKKLAFHAPQFKDTVDLKGHVFNDSFIMGAAFDIDCFQNYLILQAYTGQGEAKVHFFNLDDGTHLKSILSHGRGPGEALAVTEFDVDKQSGEVLFYDVMLHKMYRFNIDSVIRNENPATSIHSSDFPVYMYAAYWGKDGYIAKGGLRLKTGEAPRFSIIRNDTVTYSHSTYSEISIPAIQSEKAVNYFLYTHIGVSPDKTKLACLFGLGAIFEVFDISGDKIVLNTIKGFYEPIFDVDKNRSVVSIPQKTIHGFTDIYVTDKYIYAPFSKEMSMDKRTDFAVFDWQGNCIRLYRTDYVLYRICVDEKNNKVYAIGRNKNLENLLVEFNLNEPQ